MIREIENRRSIRKYKPDEIERKLIEEIIYSASLAPSAKNPLDLVALLLQEPQKTRTVSAGRQRTEGQDNMPFVLYSFERITIEYWNLA